MKKRILSISLLIAAAMMITAGVLNGDFADTTNKAIRICMECIGLG